VNKSEVGQAGEETECIVLCDKKGDDRLGREKQLRKQISSMANSGGSCHNIKSGDAKPGSMGS